MSQRPLSKKVESVPNTEFKKIFNINLVLDTLRKDGVALLGISHNDILSGSTKNTSLCILSIIQHFVFHENTNSYKTKISSMVQKISMEQGFFINNLKKGIQVGFLLPILVNKLDKTILTIGSIKTELEHASLDEIVKSNEKMMVLAFENFGIPQLIDVKNVDDIDESALLLYLSYFYERIQILMESQIHQTLLQKFEEMNVKLMDKLTSMEAKMLQYDDQLRMQNLVIESQNQHIQVANVKVQEAMDLIQVQNSTIQKLRDEILSSAKSNHNQEAPTTETRRSSQEKIETPKNLEEVLSNPFGSIYFLKKHPHHEATLGLYGLTDEYATRWKQILSNDDITRQVDTISLLIQNVDNGKYIDCFNREKWKEKDVNMFDQVYDKLYAFLSQKYTSFVHDPVWAQIGKIHVTKDEKKPSQNSLGLFKTTPQASEIKKMTSFHLDQFLDIFKNSQQREVFLKYAESVNIAYHVELLQEILKFKEITADLISRDKKLIDLFDRIDKLTKSSDSGANRASHALQVDLVRQNILNLLADDFESYRKSFYWNEMVQIIKSGREPPKKDLNALLSSKITKKKTEESLGLKTFFSKSESDQDDENMKPLWKISPRRLFSESNLMSSSNIPKISPQKLVESSVIEVEVVEVPTIDGSTTPKRKEEPISPIVEPNAPKVKELSKEELLFEYCKVGNLDKFMEASIDITDLKSLTDLRERKSLLHYAVQSKNILLVEYLIAKGCDIDATDKEFRTPLLLACVSGDREVCLHLLGNQAKPNVKDHYGMFPLLIVLKKHNFEIAEDLLLFNANINFKRDNGNTLLHEAVISEDVEMLKWILGQKNIKTKLNVNNKDGTDKTALVKSIECENHGLFAELLAYPGIDVFGRDEANRNIVQMIVTRSKVEHLKVFIAKPILDVKTMQKLFSDTWGTKNLPLLHLAIDTKNFKVVATLVTIMMKLSIDLKQVNGDGQSTLERINQMASMYVGEFITSKLPQEKKDLENVVKIRQFLENNM